jgi:hypothetical protein
LNGTYELVVCPDYVNLSEYDTDNKKKTTVALIDASKEIGLEADA